jgi:hypothetical protein
MSIRDLIDSTPRRGRAAVPDRIQKLKEGFDHYQKEFDQRDPFNDNQLAFHRALIEARKNRLGTVASAVSKREFLKALKDLLQIWRMDMRASEILPLDDFITQIQAHQEDLQRLEAFRIDMPPAKFREDVLPPLIALVMGIGVTKNESKVVSATKTLHHLLPDLVPPMDRTFTGAFFSWHAPYLQDRQEACLEEALMAFNEIASSYDLGQRLGPKWRTAPAKLLDNAVIGFCLSEGLSRP